MLLFFFWGGEVVSVYCYMYLLSIILNVFGFVCFLVFFGGVVGIFVVFSTTLKSNMVYFVVSSYYYTP